MEFVRKLECELGFCIGGFFAELYLYCVRWRRLIYSQFARGLCSKPPRASDKGKPERQESIIKKL